MHETRPVPPLVVGLLLFGTLAVSTGYGMLLLLPLYVTHVGGTEADYGVVTAAGAVTAAVAIGLLIRFPQELPPQYLFAATAVVYGISAVAVSFLNSYGVALVCVGIVLGTAWAVAYTTAPMIISELVDDSRRGAYIGYVTGMIQIGFGLGPILGNTILRLGMSFATVFRCAAVVSLLAGVAVVGLGRLAPGLPVTRRRALPGADDVGSDLRGIVRSPAVVPLVMVLLCACLFTTMNSFQTTFAARNQLNFDIFYATYTIAVIFSRFALVRLIPDPTAPATLRMATVGIVFSSLVFLVVGGNPVIYGVASAMLGVTYGLALPGVQASAVNLSSPRLRPRMLPLVGLMFETAILAFPLVAGWIIISAGYTVLFLVLVLLAVATAALSFVTRQRPSRDAVSPEPV